jgi:hypothetical protein
LGGTLEEYGRGVQQTSDGGYIVISGEAFSNDGNVSGHHGSSAYSDIWVVKLSSTGVIQWQKSLGGTMQERGFAIQQTSDGGYVVAGETYSIDGDVSGKHGLNDFWVVKLSSSGTIEWQKCYGGNGDDWANAIQQTSDGGYIVAGKSGSADGDVTGHHGYNDYWVVKTDGSGNIQWQKSLGGIDDDYANSVSQTPDGGYIVAGDAQSTSGDITGHHGHTDCWVVKLDANGALQWQKSLGGTGYDYGFSVKPTVNGGYIVTGFTDSNNGDVTGKPWLQ